MPAEHAHYEVSEYFDLASHPPGLTDKLHEGVVELNYVTERGEDPAEWPKIREGWAEFYEQNRIRDLDRLVVVHDGERMIHATGWSVLSLGEQGTMLWARMSLTDPTYQGRGVMREALPIVVSPPWGTSQGSPAWLVARTLNPWVYEVMRASMRLYPPIASEQFYPSIRPDGELEPIPSEIRALARKMAALMPPDCPFDDEHFVFHGFLERFGFIYRQPAPASRESGTSRFFARHVDPDRQDGLLVFFRTA